MKYREELNRLEVEFKGVLSSDLNDLRAELEKAQNVFKFFVYNMTELNCIDTNKTLKQHLGISIKFRYISEHRCKKNFFGVSLAVIVFLFNNCYCQEHVYRSLLLLMGIKGLRKI